MVEELDTESGAVDQEGEERAPKRKRRKKETDPMAVYADQYESNKRYINENYASLHKDYGDKFVAVKGLKVVDSDLDFGALILRLTAKYNPTYGIVVQKL